VSLNSFYLSIDVGLVSTGFSNIGECHSKDSTGLVPDFIGTKISLCRSQLLVNLGSNKIWYRYKSGVSSVRGTRYDIWDLGAKILSNHSIESIFISPVIIMNSLDHLHHDTTDRIQLDTVSVDPNEEPPKNKKKKKKKKKKKTGAEAGTTDTSATDATTTTIDTTNTTTAKGETNAVTAASRYKCTACGKPASMKCPTCQKLGLPKGMSSFCSQKCFKENWSTHKALHKTMRGSNKKQSSATDGPVDLLAVPREFKHFEFTGDYRPAYVTPQKRCPSHIIGPDYSRHVQGVSASEKAARHQPPPERGSKELDVLRSVCVLGREIIDVAGKAVAAGVTGDELDTIVHEATIERGGYPSPLNYYCFPKSVCVSPNEVICHGIPNCRPLKNGDIVNLDVTIYKDGMHADLNETFLVGDVSDEHVELVKTAYKCLQEATNSVKVSTNVSSFLILLLFLSVSLAFSVIYFFPTAATYM
jgi:hypothetical protein